MQRQGLLSHKWLYSMGGNEVMFSALNIDWSYRPVPVHHMNQPAATTPANTVSTETTPAKATGHRPSVALMAALGVVYGSIGTSPLYAFRESVAGQYGVGVAPDAVLGVLSMIFWSITLMVAVKYVLLVLNADNDGEGGVLALLALVLRQFPVEGRWRRPAIVAGLIGAATFYGDAAITPAISVLSAVEGLAVVAPDWRHWVLPLSVLILIALFVAQRFSTARLGHLFGPVMLLWFLVLALLGISKIVANPAVLIALEPGYALNVALTNPLATLTVLAAVFLALTGAEALYADIGRVGVRPIRVAWFWLVMPALVLNYFGQGAMVLADPSAAKNPFFIMAPEFLRLPLVVLAVVATTIASQAVISGAFTTTAQAVKLGFLPRLPIKYLSGAHAGHIYISVVNWLLFLTVVALALGFKNSSNLAAAYGLAVAATMVVTTLGVMVAARNRWDWSRTRTLAVFIPFLCIDLVFLSANSVKVTHGGWFSLVFGAILYLLFSTWSRGRAIVRERQRKSGLALIPFLKSLSVYPPTRVEGTAVFLTAQPEDVPSALLHNLKHNRVLHERVIFLTAQPENVPHVVGSSAIHVQDLGDGCWLIKVRLGFLDPYGVEHIARLLSKVHDFELVPEHTSFFLTRQIVLVGRSGGMAPWREHLFAWMMRNSQPASEFFHIPPTRVIEIGTQVVI